MPTMPSISRDRLAVWAALMVIYVVWGSTYLGIAIAIETMPPFTMAAIRYAIAGILLLAFVAVRYRSILRMPTAAEWRDSLIVGALLAAVGNGFVSWGEQTVPSGITALFIALMPAWLAVLGWLAFRDRLPWIVVVGIVVGLVGVAVLAWPVGGPSGRLDPLGLAAVLIAPAGWSSGSLYAARRAHLPQPALLATALQLLLGGLALGVFALATGEPAHFDPGAISGRSLLALAYLVTFGSLLAYSTYAWLLAHAPIPKIATYAYVNPVVAVILGAVILGEPITPRTIVAGAIIVVAVALIVTARSRMTRPVVAPERAAVPATDPAREAA